MEASNEDSATELDSGSDPTTTKAARESPAISSKQLQPRVSLHWLMPYLYFGLLCDTPILEAIAQSGLFENRLPDSVKRLRVGALFVSGFREEVVHYHCISAEPVLLAYFAECGVLLSLLTLVVTLASLGETIDSRCSLLLQPLLLSESCVMLPFFLSAGIAFWGLHKGYHPRPRCLNLLINIGWPYCLAFCLCGAPLWYVSLGTCSLAQWTWTQALVVLSTVQTFVTSLLFVGLYAFVFKLPAETPPY